MSLCWKFSKLEKYPETLPLESLEQNPLFDDNVKLAIPEHFLMFKNFPLLYFYRTFSKRLTVVKIIELMKTDHFKYVVVLSSQDVYFVFPCWKRPNVNGFLKLSILVKILVILLVGLFQKICLSGLAIILTD